MNLSGSNEDSSFINYSGDIGIYFFKVTSISGQSASVRCHVDIATVEQEEYEFDPVRNNFVINPSINTIDEDASVLTLSAAGSAAFPNHIGSVTAEIQGVSYSPGAWSNAGTYVDGSADASSILGGYDNINNAIGSVIISNHSFIEYNSNGHSCIIGNSYGYIASGRATIIGSRNTSIEGGSNVFCLVIGGEGCSITQGNYQSIVNSRNGEVSSSGDYNSLFGGLDNSITGGTYNTVVGGQENDITSTGNRNEILSGRGNVISGSGNYGVIVGGLNNDITGSDSAIVLGGEDNLNAEPNSVAMGNDAIARSRNSLWMGATALNEAGDCQVATVPLRVRTTNATLTQMTCGAAGTVDCPDDRKTTGTVNIILTGLRDGSADGNNDADYTQVSYTGTFGFYWDGTNGFLFDSGGQSAVTSSPTRDLTLISQTNNDFTAGAAPHLAISGGSLRVRVTGISSVIINWVAKMDICLTLVD